MKVKLTILFFFFYFHSFAQADSNVFKHKDTLAGLQTEIMLHPADGNTAYTLKKNEFIYVQSPLTLPMPSFGWWGITDRITAEFDFLPILGGLLTKPHIPWPSLNFRFGLRKQNKLIPALAFETMFQYLFDTIDQSNNPFFASWRQGASWYNHLNASWCIKRVFFIHVSAGATYSQYLQLINKDSVKYQEKTFIEKVTPDLSLSLDYRKKRISYHATVSYGSTFIGIDNVPRKFQVIYAIRLAPFYKNKFGILRSMRLEWPGVFVSFPTIKAHGYLPVWVPYFYWQWTIKQKKK